MSKPILVGYDPRKLDHAPVDFGATLARLTGAELIVASVESAGSILPISAGPYNYAIGHIDNDLVADCAPALAQVEEELRARGIRFECRRVTESSAARGLHEEAERIDAGLLVVGSSRGSTAGRVLAGSTGERLLHGAPCPVSIVPPEWREEDGRLDTIGVAFVDTEEGREALHGAHALARQIHARLRVFTVVKVNFEIYAEAEPGYVAGQRGKDVEDVEGEHKVQAQKALRTAVEALGDDVPVEVEALIGDPAEVLIDLSRHLGLLVCGSRGYGPVRAVLLGSVTRRLTAEAECPVVVLPRGVKASLDALVREAAAAPA